jgi:hypothetical protein
MRITPQKDRLVVGVTFMSRAPAAEIAPSATVRIFLPGTGEQMFVTGVLEKSPMTLRGNMARFIGPKALEAEVGIGAAHTTLWLQAP